MAKKKIDLEGISGQIESLARITNSGFSRTNERMDKVERRLDGIEVDVREMKQNVNFLRSNLVNREEFNDVVVRLKFLERRVGVKQLR
ncbi:MAG: hypothetical protein COV10_03240 [Candidatus Vogelbacteria bacterium CG10_big_fil_rev_8_21_14_0_10_51_16]|uniref:t-SNARE coiled-coil homology domain-containing protein n=1 Tax=Candidatus Vogelbacteria bacterium CG10_big_fil_rev_8_21_14_0_10_51_16 TaxID=1975045 RepID=A0A2H0RDQ2_9BACT|nr:MAG: hypothetical protein COV10_03240 [Candidatus Vogelbacteria bacterium CG10_big_fil_rev_8_21_14_0_10_51_16]